jgi:amidase
MSTLALGSDGGGSIRIPAACCGVVGYKPAPGLVPLPGGAATHWLGLSAVGPLARSADDAALMLDVLAGRPPRPPITSPATPLRIAVSTRAILIGGRVDPAVIAATRDAAQRLAAAGAMVIEADPPYPLDISLRFSRRWFAGISEEAERLPAGRLEPRTRSLARVGGLIRRLGIASPVDREPLGGKLKEWFGKHDLLLAPTLSSPAVPHDVWNVGWLASTLRAGSWIMTAQWNLVAFPAVSVPVGLSNDRLPLAVQLAAPPGREDLLLAAAHHLGELMPIPAWNGVA